MEFAVILVLIAVVVGLVVRARRRDAPLEPGTSAKPAARPSAPAGTDLRALPSKRQRIRGTHAYVPSRLRSTAGGLVYTLMREPSNRHDSNAIVVEFDGKKVGYVSAATAASYAPILDTMGAGPFVVGGAAASQGTIKLFVDLPRVPDLRAFAKAL